jgi:hypothetical protein
MAFAYQYDSITVTGHNWDPISLAFSIPFQSGMRLTYETSMTSMSLFNSFYNISPEYENTVLSLVFQGTQYDIALEPSFLSIEDIN